MRAPKPGDEVKITFLDHVENSDDDKPVTAVLYGRVHKVTDEAITIDAWANEDSDAKRSPGDGIETFTLVRSCIRATEVVESWRSL
jgi:hypothetical protein